MLKNYICTVVCVCVRECERQQDEDQ